MSIWGLGMELVGGVLASLAHGPGFSPQHVQSPPCPQIWIQCAHVAGLVLLSGLGRGSPPIFCY